MQREAEFDIIVYGASGFTGRLVTEYLAGRYGVGSAVKWAIAGRSAEKLIAVRNEIGLPRGISIVLADANDPPSLNAMASRGRAVISAVGPYQTYGSALVAACVETGTDYLDLCGEPAWMRGMIDAHEATAQSSGARIVFSCGFDSIPFELGVWFLQEEAKSRLGATVPRVKGRVRGMKGTLSGGTIASLRTTMAAAVRDRSVLDLLKNPFSLTPGFTGPAQPPGAAVVYDEDLGAWTGPFMMAAINTRNVHRSNLLMGHPYGQDFVYDEMIMGRPGGERETLMKAIADANASISAEGWPKPGEGPGKTERDAGFYDVLFVGIAADSRQIRVSVTGDRDPGYGSTSKIIAETAVCLVHEAKDVRGGIWTPGSALRGRLLARLEREAGLKFTVEGAQLTLSSVPSA